MMKKKLICLVVIIMLFCTGCTKSGDQKIVGTDTGITTRFENALELQKNVFIGRIESVSTENALITKYNLDITSYTVYVVDITQSIDGYTPLGQAKIYCVGTTEYFLSRINMKKGEQYIIEAQPWVYGDEIIYLLSIYTTAYPRIDTAGMVTLAQNEQEALSCGSLEEYLAEYDKARSAVEAKNPDFFAPENILERFGAYVAEIYEKNTAADAYSQDKGYQWLPDSEFIAKTSENSRQLYDRYTELESIEQVTQQQVSEFIISVLGGEF